MRKLVKNQLYGNQNAEKQKVRNGAYKHMVKSIWQRAF